MSTNNRKTEQRAAIVRAIEEMDFPFTPQQLLERAQKDKPTLGIATVYRSVRDLVQQGFVRKVIVAGIPPRYERTNLKHHHHFHCLSCGEVFPLEGCPLKKSYELPAGFKVLSHEVIFTGVCAKCSASASVEMG